MGINNAIDSGQSLGTSASVSFSSVSGADTSKILTTSVITPDVSPNLISVDVTVGYADIFAGAEFPVYVPPDDTFVYKIRNIFLNKVGTNFDGAGSDRNLALTDLTNVYSIIPAATLKSLTNAVWGSTALPFPASISINTTLTVSGGGYILFCQYSGGAFDYTVGELTLTVLLERIS